MRSHDYGDVLSRKRGRTVPAVEAEQGLVVEDAGSGFRGTIVRIEHGNVILANRRGTERAFPLHSAGFLLNGEPVTLIPAVRRTDTGPAQSASGSVHAGPVHARIARASRIWVEGSHDAELVERVWGHDLRVEGVVVEPLNGIDDLASYIADFGTGQGRRLGVLVDHLIKGSKECRIVDAITDENVLVTGHPYVDIWQAVKPQAVGIAAWPAVPRGVPWKEGVCELLGWGEPAAGWRRVLASVASFRDLETPLIGSVERLIDFVTEPQADHA